MCLDSVVILGCHSCRIDRENSDTVDLYGRDRDSPQQRLLRALLSLCYEQRRRRVGGFYRLVHGPTRIERVSNRPGNRDGIDRIAVIGADDCALVFRI